MTLAQELKRLLTTLCIFKCKPQSIYKIAVTEQTINDDTSAQD